MHNGRGEEGGERRRKEREGQRMDEGEINTAGREIKGKEEITERELEVRKKRKRKY